MTCEHEFIIWALDRVTVEEWTNHEIDDDDMDDIVSEAKARGAEVFGDIIQEIVEEKFGFEGDDDDSWGDPGEDDDEEEVPCLSCGDTGQRGDDSCACGKVT